MYYQKVILANKDAYVQKCLIVTEALCFVYGCNTGMQCCHVCLVYIVWDYFSKYLF